jgi:large repetitive protein
MVLYAQDLTMANGIFNRCAPDMFYDSGGEFGNYGNDENLVTTICPQSSDDFIILNFLTFSTQVNQDIMTIYDGDNTSAPILGTFSGVASPGNIRATAANTSGCLTIQWISNASGTTIGWEAEILCASPCQTIIPSIDSTNPSPNGSGVITINPGTVVDFQGSASFSDDDSAATYSWDFGDGNSANGTNVSNTFNNPGTYIVEFTASDDNPQGCGITTTVTVVVLGPNIVVDQNSFTVEQLVTDVLINSPCAQVSNITSSTGITFAANNPNGIGYFVSNGIDFPFEEGVLLMSGDASQAEGPNNVTLSGGNWPGDADLNNAVGIVSNDATFIQFDFVPLANAISFDFLMASEEYDQGSFECEFSDAFAFLLTDSAGNTTNLAVLPGTNTPILVTNIHPFNGFCPAINEEFFGGYTNFNQPPTAFDGRTAVFTAQSDVTPGETYTIKLVIADANDNLFDSGVFLRAGSFSIGGDLGEDLTIEANNAPCNGDIITLDTGLSGASHIWYKDGVVIDGETNSTLEVTENGNYSVDISFSGVCDGSDSVVIEFREAPEIQSFQDLSICSFSGIGEFNLFDNNALILGSQNPDDFEISYHLTELEAINFEDPLPDNYTNISNPQTIFFRIADVSQTCFLVDSFQLVSNVLNVNNNITPINLCDDAVEDGFIEFDLTQRNEEILGTLDPANTQITYHLNQIDADNGINQLPNNYTNISNPQTIFVRLETVGDPNCYNTSSIDLNVIPNPLANLLSDLEVCDDDNDGFAQFDLSLRDVELIGVQTDVVASYHETQSDADLGVNPLPTLYNNIVPGTQTIFARIESTTAGCFDTTPLNLIVNPIPEFTAITTYELCDDTNPGDEQEIFDLSTKDAEIINAQPNVTVSYHATQAEAETGANPLPNLYTNTSNPQTIYVALTNTNTSCNAVSSFTISVNPLPQINAPTPLEVCDDNIPDGFTQIDLSVKDAEITGGNSNYTINYYLTQADADNQQNPLPISYTNISNPQTIYAGVTDNITGCLNITTLDLVVEQAPIANVPTPLEFCDADNDGFGVFTLTNADAEITGGVAGLSVSYHETQSDADNNVNPLSSPYSNIVINQQTVYARVESATIATDCATIVPLQLVVQPTPVVPQNISDYILCDTDQDGITQFDLTIKTAEILGSQDPVDYTLRYHLTQAEAETATNPIVNTTGYTNLTNPQTIYVSLEGLNGCITTGSFTLVVNLPPIAIQPTPLAICDDEIADEQTPFDLTQKNNEITAGNAGWTVSYYETQADAENDTNAIPDPTQYTNTAVGLNPANPQTLYVRVTDTNTGCIDLVTLTIRVLPNPTPGLAPDDLIQCDTTNPGDGVEQFDLTQNELYIINGETGVTPSYHTSQEDADSNTNAIADPTQYTNESTPVQPIYVRVTNDVTGCYTTVNFNVIVNPLPDVVAVTDEIICEVNTDGFFTFDLTEKSEEILNGQDPSIFTVSYYQSQADADNRQNAIANPTQYTNITNPQRIYVAITNTATDCYISTQSFEVEVQEGAQANADGIAIIYEQCDDNVETDGDAGNDSVQFDLSTQDAQVLDGQDPANYQVSYYQSQEDADLGVNPLPTLYENLSNPQQIWARVDNNTTAESICYAVAPLTLQVNPLPVFNIDLQYTLCLDENGTEVINPPVIATGLSETDYAFEWSYNGEVLPGETGSALTPNQGGSYTVTVIDISTSAQTACEVTQSTEVIESAPPSLALTINTQAFAGSHQIEAVATGIGDYEYNIDNGPWQDSGLFDNVSIGTHTITARDKNGCGLVSETITVIDYPLYFTPNGDGVNDRWNIVGLNNQPSAKIYIFDRYGKLLKQLSPAGNGWDGTFNGQLMPSNDYWFTVEYQEPGSGETQEFRAHFTLKR